jgi:hypothetical protein
VGDRTLLEFVTSPCKTVDEALRAVGYASELAAELAKQAGTPGAVLSFAANQRLLEGTWLKECTLTINDLDLVAKPQGTVGVPLAGLRGFIEEMLRGEGKAGESYLTDLAEIRKLSGLDFDNEGDNETKEMYGFLTACHIFLLRAVWASSPLRAIGADGRPLEPKDGDFYRVFAIKDSNYLKQVTYKVGDRSVPSFCKETTGDCRVLVHRDSPKSAFQLLHRTDFCSMYHVPPDGPRELLRTDPGKRPQALWPQKWGNPELFLFPYRADLPITPPRSRSTRLWAGPATG